MSFEEYNNKFDKWWYYDSSIEDWFEKEKQKFKKEFEKFDEYCKSMCY